MEYDYLFLAPFHTFRSAVQQVQFVGPSGMGSQHRKYDIAAVASDLLVGDHFRQWSCSRGCRSTYQRARSYHIARAIQYNKWITASPVVTVS